MNRPPPPEIWQPGQRVAQKLLRPLERFLHVQAASGILLLVAALIALLWANSPWSSSYHALWHAPVTLGFGRFVSSQSLHFWINDGLMAIFFLVVGLEIRRELAEGELSDAQRAALPVAAAVGGMVVPALIYFALNPSGPSRPGWGVPMATDIAFAVGVLALLGKRVPAALRVLLLALAIIDDIGAILVIAVFYSGGVQLSGLGVALAGAALTVVLQRLGVRRALVYLLPGVVVWYGTLSAGVHPTIAGVIMGLLTPVKSWFGKEGLLAETSSALDDVRARADRSAADLVDPLKRIRRAEAEALPPVTRVERALHPWVAYGVMPLFALANAGVSLTGLTLDDPSSLTVLGGVTLGLVLGKPAGILLATFVTVKLGLCRLPRGATWSGVLLVGAVAGIGFTMALFIAGLAFPSGPLLGAAKLAVLSASGLAALLGLVAGALLLPRTPSADAAATATDAERSTEK